MKIIIPALAVLSLLSSSACRRTAVVALPLAQHATAPYQIEVTGGASAGVAISLQGVGVTASASFRAELVRYADDGARMVLYKLDHAPGLVAGYQLVADGGTVRLERVGCDEARSIWRLAAACPDPSPAAMAVTPSRSVLWRPGGAQ